MLDTVRRWVWHGDFLARTLAGLFHPLIHIGYGLEFELPSIVAEGLSMTACTEASYSQIIPHLPKLQTGSLTSVQIQSYAENAGSSARGLASQLISMLSDKVSGLGINDPMASPSHTSNTATTKDDAAIDSHLSTIPPYLRENKLFEIFAKIKHDPAFDGIVSPELNNEFHKVLSNPNVTSRIKHYVQLWHLDQNQKDIQSKFKDLHLFSALALGAAAIREDHPGVIKLDFFLMHALTSAEFVHQYLSHITPSEAVILLHGQLASFIVAYIVVNRPTLNVEGLLKYKSSLDNIKTNNPWTMAIDKSLDCKEAHVIKSVRSCAVGQVISGRHQDVRLNEIWLKVAKMCIEVDGNWTFGVGFDEKWE
jgi:hypothetical protein